MYRLGKLARERHDLARELNMLAAAQDLLDSALGDHLALPRPVGHNHAQAAALKVERDLVDLLPCSVHSLGVLKLSEFDHDCLVDQVAQAGLKVAVEIGAAEHTHVLATERVKVPLEHHLVLREGARLVAAEHVHGTEVLYGAELLDDNVLTAQSRRPAREAGGHDHREHLRRDAHGDRHRKEKRVEPGTLGEAADHEHNGAHDQHERHEHARNRGHARIKRRKRLPAARELARNTAKIGRGSRRHRHAQTRTALHRCAGKGDVRAVAEREQRGRRAVFAHECGRALLLRLGLTGERRLVHEQVACLHDAQVGRDHVARSKTHDIAGHHVGHGNLKLARYTRNAASAHAAGVAHHIFERGRSE